MAPPSLVLPGSNQPGTLSPISPTASSSTGGETIVATPTSTASSLHKCDDCDSHWRKLDGLQDPAFAEPKVSLHGWPELAQWITKNPDLEAFEPFRDLHIKSLLYYQAELDTLRNSLHRAEWNDHRYAPDEAFPQSGDIAKNVNELLDCKYNKEGSRGRYQLDLVKEIRQVLKEYSDALLQYKQITALPQADKVNVNSLRVWLRNVHGDNIPVSGPGTKTWGGISRDDDDPVSIPRQFYHLLRSIFVADKNQGDNLDLVVPRYNHNIDGLTYWVVENFVPFWNNFRDDFRERWRKNKQVVRNSLPYFTEKTPDPPSLPDEGKEVDETPTLTKYSEHRVLQFTSVVATVVACLLPTAAIAVLSNVETTGRLLGLIAGFTTAFALGLMMLTDAGTSRVQIFTATAAFSAVLVVFVQNQNQGQPSKPAG